jgi:uncharacterized protein YkwD
MRILWLAVAVSALALSACSADTGSDSSDEALASFDTFQKHNLAVVNAYRAKKGVKPLKLSAALSKFALAGSKELMKDHTPHAHFMAAAKDGSIWHDGFHTLAGENQGDPNGWPRLVASDPAANEKAQIDAIQKAMYAEGPGKGEAHGHYENMMNPKFHRLGVGLVRASGGLLYLTNDFSD